MHLEVKLMNGGYHASRSNLRNTQDWPPPPARLFSALASGYYDLTRAEGDQPEARRALEWLENHLPEVRFAKPCEPVGDAKYTAYVPVNKVDGFKKDKWHGQTRRSFLWPDRQERSFPAVYPEQPYVYYSWPDLTGPWDQIRKIIGEVYYFGTSRSQATFRLLEELPEHAHRFLHYAPAGETAKADLRLFVYYPGRLRELDSCFDLKVRAPNSALPYARVVPPKEQPHHGMFSETVIYRILSRKVFDVTNAALVADAFRNEMLSLCTQQQSEPQSVVAHDPDKPHLAYLPLPFVTRYWRDGRPADNLIHGVGVGIPHGLGRDEIEAVKKILNTVERFRYAGREFDVALAGGENQPKTLRTATWAAPATTWATVTPAEVRWRDDNNQYLREHCEQLGLPEIVGIETHSHSLYGPDPARAFVSRNYEKGRQAGFLTHAVIEFARPVAGPLAVGRTRNFGLGLLRPIYD